MQTDKLGEIREYEKRIRADERGRCIKAIKEYAGLSDDEKRIVCFLILEK